MYAATLGNAARQLDVNRVRQRCPVRREGTGDNNCYESFRYKNVKHHHVNSKASGTLSDALLALITSATLICPRQARGRIPQCCHEPCLC